MFLMKLNQKQKKIFLELAYLISSADGNYSDDEKEMVIAYCNEMGMDTETEIKEKNIDEIVTELNQEFGTVEKKIVIFEIIGLAMVDGNFDEKERKVLDEVQNSIGITEDYCLQCESILKTYIDLQNKINDMVLM